jgi:hypothetical protein
MQSLYRRQLRRSCRETARVATGSRAAALLHAKRRQLRRSCRATAKRVTGSRTAVLLHSKSLQEAATKVLQGDG